MKTLTNNDVQFFLTCEDESDARFQEIAKVANSAICEWRGWTDVKPRLRIVCGGSEVMLLTGFLQSCEIREVPNHITGLEALGNMHEAENGLTGWQVVNYKDKLREVVGQGEEPSAFDLLHATARQRAIALCQVIKPELFQ